MANAPVSAAQDFFDEPTFLRRVTWKLTPTSIKGVYTHPVPSDDFDPYSLCPLFFAHVVSSRLAAARADALVDCSD
jgi:hypothetical protein